MKSVSKVPEGRTQVGLKPEGLAGPLYDKASFFFSAQPGTLFGLQLLP